MITLVVLTADVIIFVVSCVGDFVFVFWQRFEKKYKSELSKGAVSKDTKFEYAWCLVRSKYTNDIKKGIVLLEGESIYSYHKFLLIYSMILLDYEK